MKIIVNPLNRHLYHRIVENIKVNIKTKKYDKLLYRSAAVPSLANCSTECTQLGSDWFAVTDDVCVCGHAASIIHCEEEIGPVVEVFCIEKEKVKI